MKVVRKEEIHTIDDIYALSDGERAELIDGRIYYMAPPSRTHQRILGAVYRKIADYIDSKGGDCEVFPSPFAVFLNNDISFIRSYSNTVLQVLGSVGWLIQIKT